MGVCRQKQTEHMSSRRRLIKPKGSVVVVLMLMIKAGTSCKFTCTSVPLLITSHSGSSVVLVSAQPLIWLHESKVRVDAERSVRAASHLAA